MLTIPINTLLVSKIPKISIGNVVIGLLVPIALQMIALVVLTVGFSVAIVSAVVASMLR